jgi:hypothetical protein
LQHVALYCILSDTKALGKLGNIVAETFVILDVSSNVSMFFCVGVMYSGEYDACDVTLSNLKNMPVETLLRKQNLLPRKQICFLPTSSETFDVSLCFSLMFPSVCPL